ncbi:uncharacterized protein LOC123566027 [Mercenaria mercenaria]|uniref:uncharacterized protein LOC123566027 n=1 Tax=Mercenaria mercenaria TaxID=6596 RepID=UPI00234E83E4|nr:uncharacterized protein LOC123566027 [Mercenaria mercenaria]
MQTPVKSPVGEIRQTFWTRSPSPSRPTVTSQNQTATPQKSFWTRSPSPTRPGVVEHSTPGLPKTPKKSFWNRAPSPTNTPKRRPKEELDLPVKKAQRTVDSFTIFKDSVKKVEICTRSDNEDAIAAKCIAKYGLELYLCASNAVKHVPIMFKDRMKYISNIIREVNGQMKDSEIIDLINAVNCIKSDMSVGGENFKNVLWRTSFKHKEPYLNFLVPQVSQCLVNECGGNLYPAYISNVTLYKLTGPEPGLKCILRCRSCSSRYNIDFYTIPNIGRKLYTGDKRCHLKSSSSWSYFCQDTFEFMCESGNHAFVSHKAFADIYNSVFNEERDHEFYKWQNLYSKGPGRNDVATESDDQDFLYSCMSGKMAINAFITGELENELVERNLTEKVTLTKTHTKEMVLKEIDDLRVKELYQHECSNLCESKGCKNLRVIDACWKLNMFHCMMAVPQKADGYPLLSLPNVCIREPMPGSVFCRDHHELLTRHNIPVKKDNFLKHVGCTATDTNKAVEEKVLHFANDLLSKDPTADVGLAAVEYQVRRLQLWPVLDDTKSVDYFSMTTNDKVLNLQF